MDWLNPINWLNFFLERPDTTSWKLCDIKRLCLLSPSNRVVYIDIMLYRKYYFLYTINAIYSSPTYGFIKNYARIKSLFEKKELKGVNVLWTSGFCAIDTDWDLSNDESIEFWLNLYVNGMSSIHYIYSNNTQKINHKTLYHVNVLAKSRKIKQLFEQIEENNFLKLNIKIL